MDILESMAVAQHPATISLKNNIYFSGVLESGDFLASAKLGKEIQEARHFGQALQSYWAALWCTSKLNQTEPTNIQAIAADLLFDIDALNLIAIQDGDKIIEILHLYLNLHWEYLESSHISVAEESISMLMTC